MKGRDKSGECSIDKNIMNSQSSERQTMDSSPPLRQEANRSKSTKQLLSSIQEENQRLQQQVSQNGSVINRLIGNSLEIQLETLCKKDQDIQGVINQSRKYFHMNQKMAVLRVNPLLEPTHKTQVPHSVGQIR